MYIYIYIFLTCYKFIYLIPQSGGDQFETRQAVPHRAIRGNSISVNSTLPSLLDLEAWHPSNEQATVIFVPQGVGQALPDPSREAALGPTGAACNVNVPVSLSFRQPTLQNSNKAHSITCRYASVSSDSLKGTLLICLLHPMKCRIHPDRD